MAQFRITEAAGLLGVGLSVRLVPGSTNGGVTAGQLVTRGTGR